MEEAKENVDDQVVMNNDNDTEMELIWETLRAIQKDNESLKESNAELQEKVSKLEKENELIKQTNSSLDGIDGKVSQIMVENKQLKNQMDVMHKTLERLKNGDNEEKKEEIDELKSFLEDQHFKVNLPQYYKMFQQEGYDDFDVIKELTFDDLEKVLKVTKKA